MGMQIDSQVFIYHILSQITNIQLVRDHWDPFYFTSSQYYPRVIKGINAYGIHSDFLLIGSFGEPSSGILLLVDLVLGGVYTGSIDDGRPFVIVSESIENFIEILPLYRNYCDIVVERVRGGEAFFQHVELNEILETLRALNQIDNLIGLKGGFWYDLLLLDYWMKEGLI